jgi:hypothetical protein
LASLDASLITKTLKDSDRRHWYGCCLLKRYVGRFPCQLIFSSTRILGKSPAAHAEHFVAWFELGYLPAHRFDLAGHINAYSLVLWCAQPRDQADQRRTSHGEQVQWIYRCRAKLYQMG